MKQDKVEINPDVMAALADMAGTNRAKVVFSDEVDAVIIEAHKKHVSVPKLVVVLQANYGMEYTKAAVYRRRDELKEEGRI